MLVRKMHTPLLGPSPPFGFQSASNPDHKDHSTYIALRLVTVVIQQKFMKHVAYARYSAGY